MFRRRLRRNEEIYELNGQKNNLQTKLNPFQWKNAKVWQKAVNLSVYFYYAPNNSPLSCKGYHSLSIIVTQQKLNDLAYDIAYK